MSLRKSDIVAGFPAPVVRALMRALHENTWGTELQPEGRRDASHRGRVSACRGRTRSWVAIRSAGGGRFPGPR